MGTERLFEFKCPTRVIFGINVAKDLGDMVRRLHKESVFLVTDKGLSKSGILNRVTDILKTAGIQYEIFDNVEQNPTVKTVNQGAKVFQKEKNRVILALGGGSPIDAAKAIGVKATHNGNITEYTRHGDKVVQNITPPLIAVPTTAGTGSEVTWVSVLVDSDIKRKIVVPSPFIAPNLALVDPALTLTVPPEISASTGMDALTHAIEGYVSLKSEPISDALALEAIKLISENLRTAVKNGKDINARSNMLLASTLAGMVFINSGLGLVHSMAHALGGRYNIPHGLANAIMLPRVMRYNIVANPLKFASIARTMGEKVDGNDIEIDAEKSVISVFNLSSDIGIPHSLEELGIDASMVEQLAEDAMDDRGTFPLNPRHPTKEEVIEIFRDALTN
jgi:alcohol dehydrogenase class IV